jgi:FkbH-like protein
MKLADALNLINGQTGVAGRRHRIFLACGMTPLHLKTFLTAHLIAQRKDRPIEVEAGLYGDLVGNLEKAESVRPDGVAAVIEWSDLDPRLGYRSPSGWQGRLANDILPSLSDRLDRLQARLVVVAKHCATAVVMPTLPMPPVFASPTVCNDEIALALGERIARFAGALSVEPTIRLLNARKLDALSPFHQRLDLVSELRWGFPYRQEHASVLAGLLAKLIYPDPPKKGIITDLDDTLWRGILGEVGVDGIAWDLDHNAGDHALYQGMLALLADLGVLIAVASKNDPSLVGEALRRKDLIVPADRLFPIEAHWGPKSESVARILKTWNIAADSVVFIDDSGMDLAEVSGAFPDMQCLAFPTGNLQAIGELLETLRDLYGKTSITEEDRVRAASIKSSHTRQEAAAGASPDAFLAQSDACITLQFNAPDQRTFELINKTNQFNLNGRRLDETAWRTRLEDPHRFLITASYVDKYGQLGKIAVLSGRQESGEITVDTWVMSCRAFSRRIEHVMLRALFDRFSAEKVRVDFVATDRNGPLREFLLLLMESADAQMPWIVKERFLSSCPSLFAKVDIE